jgi:hypothetical protein
MTGTRDTTTYLYTSNNASLTPFMKVKGLASKFGATLEPQSERKRTTHEEANAATLDELVKSERI